MIDLMLVALASKEAEMYGPTPSATVRILVYYSSTSYMNAELFEFDN